MKKYGKRIHRQNSNNAGPDKGEWQLEGEHTCIYCGGSFKIEKFTIPEVNGGFCMPECVAGYNWYILMNDKEKYHEKIETFCGRDVNMPPPHHLMTAWGRTSGFTQTDVYNCRYKNLSDHDKAIAKKEIGDKSK